MNEENPSEEQVLLVVHKHWASLLHDLLYVLLPAVVALALVAAFWRLPNVGVDALMRGIAAILLPACVLAVWIMALMLWTKYYLGVLVVTDRRVFYIAQSSFVDRTVLGWNVQAIRYADAQRRGLLESLFNFGAVLLHGREEDDVTAIDGIPDPEYVCSVIQKQDDEYGKLSETTKKQRELLHFLSHEVKGHLTKSKAAFAAIVEGDYGPVGAPLDSLAHRALEDSERGVETVMSILDSADLSRGGMTFERKRFDLAQAVRRSAEELRPSAEAKRLAFELSLEGPCEIEGDEAKIERHVLRNLVDNAIRYTPEGSIRVSLEKKDGSARLCVSDTGVGIAEEDMRKLFSEGGHGSHSRDVNAESTGYGLFVAKQVVDAHGGRIWARSDGPGTGSAFFAEFPLPQNS